MSFFVELRRRNVLRVGAAYLVSAWLVVQVVETLFPVYGLSDGAVRLVVNVLAIGFVPVLVLSWVFEWTPQGLVRESERDPDLPASVRSARRLDRAILVVLALALGYFAFDRFVLVPQQMEEEVAEAREAGRSEALVESYGDASIAVLAFRDMSPEGDQEYLSDGIAEEILNLLAQIPTLRVISRSSAFTFKDKDVPIPEIGRTLNVAHVLEGSVRKSGDRIRVTAQLIDARSDTHLWSQTWDRTLDDIFAIQDELAGAAVAELQLRLLGEAPRSRRVDPEAYLLYLEGHRLVALFDSKRAALLLQQAVEIQPDYSDAWWELMRAYLQQSSTFGQKDHTGDENWFKADAAFQRLKAIDPDYPGIAVGEAWEAVEQQGDFGRAARLFESLIERHPHDWSVANAAIHFAGWIRRDDVALALARDVVARSPLCTDCSYRLARAALLAGEYREAEQEIMRFRVLVPDATVNPTLGLARLLMGDLEGAREAFTRPEEETGDPKRQAQSEAHERYADLLIRLVSGETEGVAGQIEELASTAGKFLSAEEFAGLYALLGEPDQAFSWLERALASNNAVHLGSSTRSPWLASLHDDPRWNALLAKIGLAPEQLALIEFDPVLPSSTLRPEPRD